MKTPKTYSINQARNIRKKRQFKILLFLTSIILLLVVGIVASRLIIIKEEIETLDLTTSTSIAHSTFSEPSETSILANENINSPTISSPAPDISDDSAGTNSADSSNLNMDATSSSHNTENTTPTESTSNPDHPPIQIDNTPIFIPKQKYLQTLTFQERDSEFRNLKSAITDYMATQSNIRWSIYYLNLKTNQEFGINELDPFVIGSLISWPINNVLYQNIQENKLDLNELTALPPSPLLEKSHFLKKAGEEYSLRELSYLSITNSDNLALEIITEKLGGMDEINQQLTPISGVVNFRKEVTYKNFQQVDQKGIHRTSLFDLVNYTRHFYKNYLIKPDIYQPLFNDLISNANTSPYLFVPPAPFLVAHKYGINQSFQSQASISLTFAQEPYILCIATEGENPSINQTIHKTLSKMVFEYINACYTPT